MVQMKGRIYTQVHGRSDHPDFHANRLHESPKGIVLIIFHVKSV